MTKATSLQKPSQAPRKKREANSAGASQVNACEMLVAELEARRERLQHLLAMVHLEARRVTATHVSLQPRRKCTVKRRKTAA
jgi:predicted metalloenzyme YecM